MRRSRERDRSGKSISGKFARPLSALDQDPVIGRTDQNVASSISCVNVSQTEFRWKKWEFEPAPLEITPHSAPMHFNHRSSNQSRSIPRTSSAFKKNCRSLRAEQPYTFPGHFAPRATPPEDLSSIPRFSANHPRELGSPLLARNRMDPPVRGIQESPRNLRRRPNCRSSPSPLPPSPSCEKGRDRAGTRDNRE